MPVIPDHVLLSRLGAGSYGEVWLARSAVGTLRAVKVVRRASFKSERPYEREFSGMLKFEPVSRAHEGLMDILQVGRNDAEGYFYYVMELADDARQRIPELTADASEREALLHRLKAMEESAPGGMISGEKYLPLTLAVERAMRGRLPVPECLRHFAALTNGLEALHGAGLVHRDIKPSNIIIVRGVPKLADIGLVAEMDETRSFVGTEGFIPPEGPGTPRADIYSLGKVFYELATGRDRKEYPSLPADTDAKIPPEDFFELNAIISRACAPDIKDRYASASDLRADLALLQGGRSVRRQRIVEQNFRMAQRVGVVAIALAMIGLLVAVVFIQKARMERENFRRSEQLRHELQTALAERENALVGEYRARAAAELLTPRAGRRAAALNAVAQAAKLGAPVRSEAVSALALLDLEPSEQSAAPALLKTVENAMAPDFQRYASTATNGDIVLRRFPDGRELDNWHSEIEKRPPQWLGPFSPDGKFFSYYSDSGEVVVRDEHREILRVPHEAMWSGPADPGWWVARSFSPDSRTMVVARAGEVTVFTLPEGSSRNIKLPFNASVMAYRPDGNVLLLGAKESTNQIAWLDLRDGSVRLLGLPAPTGVYSLAWSPDGRQFAIGAGDWNIYLFDATAPQKLPAVMNGHQEVPVALAFHPDGQLLVSSSWDGTTRIWNLLQLVPIVQLPRWGWNIQFNPAGTRFSCYDAQSGALRTYELTGQAVCRQMLATPRNALKQTVFAPDGSWLAAADGEAVHFFDAHNGHKIGQIPGTANDVAMLRGGNADDASLALLTLRTNCQRWPIFREDAGTWRIGPAEDIAVQTGRRLMDSDGGQAFGICVDSQGMIIYRPGQPPQLLDRSRALQQPALSPDGTRAAVTRLLDAPRGATLIVWDTQTGKAIWMNKVHERGATMFSPDGRKLAAAADDGVTVWDLAGSNLVWHAAGSGGSSREDSLAWSSDGRLLASSHDRFTIDLLDAATGEFLVQLDNPGRQLISSLRFSPDSSQLAVGCLSGRLQVWDLRELRHQLAALGLDWNHPAYPPAKETGPAGVHLIF